MTTMRLTNESCVNAFFSQGASNVLDWDTDSDRQWSFLVKMPDAQWHFAFVRHSLDSSTSNAYDYYISDKALREDEGVKYDYKFMSDLISDVD